MRSRLNHHGNVFRLQHAPIPAKRQVSHGRFTLTGGSNQSAG
jgi:hypothetical protein